MARVNVDSCSAHVECHRTRATTPKRVKCLLQIGNNFFTNGTTDSLENQNSHISSSIFMDFVGLFFVAVYQFTVYLSMRWMVSIDSFDRNWNYQFEINVAMTKKSYGEKATTTSSGFIDEIYCNELCVNFVVWLENLWPNHFLVCVCVLQSIWYSI